MTGIDDIVWEEPPPEQVGTYGRAVAELRANPGKWARLTGVSKFFAYSLRNGTLAGVDKGEFEAVTRTDAASGDTLTWARYKPKP